MRHILSSFTLITVLFLTGCFGITQPSDSDIKEMSTYHFNQQFAGLFTVTDAIKDNGYKQNDTHYVAEMTLHAQADRSLDDYAKQLVQDPSLSAFEKMTNSMAVGLLKMTLPDFAAGDQLEFKRNYLFIKTDNGWLLKKELNDETTDLL
ncbi:MAG: hypothetical protein U9R28_04000 [Pseudomonadota bacterium]|nr:hypothetical protein [Pseudomonadota bacterium]